MQAWILFTLLAAAMQSVRTAGQKQLARQLTPMATTLVRYVFGLPFAISYLCWLTPEADLAFIASIEDYSFIIFASAAALAQILATMWLVKVLSYRNFAVGSSFAKTEAMQTAIFGALFFGAQLAFWGWVAVLLAMLGILVVSIGAKKQKFDKYSAFYGVLCGIAFAFTSLWLRQASIGLPYDYTINAAITLVYMVSLQSIICFSYVLFRERKQLRKILAQFWLCLFVGATSAFGSIGWFTAMTYQNPALVKSLGQIEFVFTLLITYFFFKEKVSARELLGMGLIIVSVILLLLT